MNFTYWTGYSKRRNSTAKPATTGTDAACVLKEDTSITAPTIKLQGHTFFNVTYGYIADFGRYYFIRDVRTVGSMTEIDLTVDVLSTYESNIRATSQYVERADMGAAYVCTVPDPLNPPTDEVEIESTDIINLGWAGDPTLILGAVSKDGVNYYAMDEARLKLILGGVFNNSFSQNVQDQFYGIREFLVSLKKVPYTPSGTTDTVMFGQYDTQDSATRVSDTIIHDNASALVKFPSMDHLNTGNYCDFAPYTTCAAFLPYVGVVPLDPYILGNNKTLTVDYWLDQKTADVAYRLTAGGVILGTFSGNCGADLPIATQHYNPVGVISAALASIGGAATGNPALAASGVFGAFDGFSWHSQINGTLSSYIGNSVGTLVTVFVITKVPQSWNLNAHRAEVGVPFQEVMSLSSHTGYILCRNAHVAIPGSDSERSELESFMNGGIFLV